MSVVALPTVSQSFAARYDACPLSAKFAAEEERFHDHPRARGSVFHAFAARLLRECIASGQATYAPDEARDLVEQVIREENLPAPVSEYDKALRALAWKFAAEHVFDIENIVDIEHTYSAEVAGVLVTGTPDYVAVADRVAEIRDWKTSWSTESEEDFAGTIQLRIYALLIFAAYPHVHTCRLILEYPRWGVTREVEVERAQLERLELDLETLVERVKRSRAEDEWPASPGSWCTTCPAPLRCPIPAEQRSAGEITSEEVAQAAANYLVGAEAAVKGQKAALRAWCSEHGAVAVGDLEWGFELASDSERADKAALREAMVAAGMRWEDFWRSVKGSAVFKARKVKS